MKREIIVAILAAILGAAASYHYQEFMQAPREGLGSIEVSPFPSDYVRELGETVISQIKEFPGRVVIRHLHGPAIKDVKVSIVSDKEIIRFQKQSGNEDVSIKQNENKKNITLEMPLLRAGVEERFEFATAAPASVQFISLVGTGKMVLPSDQDASDHWSMPDGLLSVLGITIMGTLLGVVPLFILWSNLDKVFNVANMSVDSEKAKRALIFAIFAAIVSMPLEILPFPSIMSVLSLAILFYFLLQRVKP